MLKQNLIANYLGQGWRALMSLAFIPLYIEYLGMDAYGLIGIHAVLQATLGLIENGLNPALGREMARFTGGRHSPQSIRNLLRSIEITIVILASFVALGLWAASSWLASHWLNPGRMSVSVVAQALALMGGVIGLRFIENVYTSSLIGLQRQILQNVVTSIAATVRGLGAVAILAWISPTIGAFFLWQALVSVLTVACLSGLVNRALPTPPRRPQFSFAALAGIWRFAAGMVVITVFSVVLGQIDKVLLSKLLSLEAFGYYTLATVIASALYLFTGPISTAFYPHLTKLLMGDDRASLSRVYHQGAQLISVLMGSAAVLLIVFGDRVVYVWTGDMGLANQVAPLLAVIAAGTLVGGLALMPYYLQLSSGWTSLRARIDGAAVVLVVPAALVVVPQYGAMGAAWLWFILSAARTLTNVPLMHRRLLKGEQGRWFLQDVVLPLFGASFSAIALRLVVPEDLGRLPGAVVLLSVSCMILFVSSVVSPSIRSLLRNQVHRCLRLPRARDA